MATIRNKEVLKATSFKHTGTTASDADKVSSDDDRSSSSSSKDLYFRGFSIKKRSTRCSTYHDFTACDVPKFMGDLNPIAITRWITVAEGAFRTSECEDKNKVNFATNFLRDNVKIWWEGKMCKKGEDWVGSCSWKEFKEMFNAKYVPVKEIDKIREEFHSLVQTNETVNELWKKINDMVPYCLEYLGNEKLKVDKFQRMLKNEIREVISPFKCTTLEDLLGRARIREADLIRKKNDEKKELKRKQEHGDVGSKRARFDHGKKSSGSQVKSPCNKCHKLHYGECRLNMKGCYKCGDLNHMSRDSLGWHLEEIHVTWTQFGKKRDKIATLHKEAQLLHTDCGDGIKISSDAVRICKRRLSVFL
ncbi:zinc finger, CCHC-type, retrotransposon gag domain protein [Tanacetum coccineum]